MQQERCGNGRYLAQGMALPYLGEDSVPAAGVQCRVGTVLPGQAPVDIQLWRSVRGIALRELETVGDESCALLGQQQEWLHVLARDKQEWLGPDPATVCPLSPSPSTAPGAVGDTQVLHPSGNVQEGSCEHKTWAGLSLSDQGMYAMALSKKTAKLVMRCFY